MKKQLQGLITNIRGSGGVRYEYILTVDPNQLVFQNSGNSLNQRNCN
ncbi:MAG: hypothetical protein HGN29_11320 [Asgard group archaeon]|nr:hypothetical protein [Asgard group archaeon]